MVDLSMSARNFLVVDKRSLARLELSDDVRLNGPFSHMVLTGNVNIERATFYLPDLAAKTALSLDPTIDPDVGTLVDTNLVEVRRTFLGQQRRDVQQAIQNLQVPSLQVEIGNDVWLRSAEANIKLGGQVALRKDAANQRLDGSIDVERGTYRLDLGLVQRTFQVDSGTVTFYNDPQQAGTLNIWATYTVRQANQLSQDVRIIAHIGGTLLDPKLDLSSDERFALSYTEILSYLVFGQPSLLGSGQESNNALRPVAQALLPSAGALIERAINSQIGFFNVVQVQTGNTNNYDRPDEQRRRRTFFPDRGSASVSSWGSVRSSRRTQGCAPSSDRASRTRSASRSSTAWRSISRCRRASSRPPRRCSVVPASTRSVRVRGSSASISFATGAFDGTRSF